MNHTRPLAVLAAVVAAVALTAASGPALAQKANAPQSVQSQITIPAAEVNGIPVYELSGLAWDADEQLLYAVSDKGYVFHFRLKFDGDKLAAAEPVYAGALADPNKKTAPRKGFNAEGIAVQNGDNGKRGDSTLVVSLEGGNEPTILRFSPTGAVLEQLAVPAPLNDVSNFRKKKRGLESVAFHPEFGLLTAPESPLEDIPKDQHAVYAKGRHWAFAGYAPKSRLKAMNVLPDGNLLVLERSSLDSSDSLTPSVRRVDIENCPAGGVCSAEDLAVLPASLNNFEGMTRLGDGRVLIVSDQGAKDRQDTTLVVLKFPGA